MSRADLVECLLPLAGKRLRCHCPAEAPCHADVLVEVFQEVLVGDEKLDGVEDAPDKGVDKKLDGVEDAPDRGVGLLPGRGLPACPPSPQCENEYGQDDERLAEAPPEESALRAAAAASGCSVDRESLPRAPAGGAWVPP